MIKPEGHLDSPPSPPLPRWLTQATWKAPVVLLTGGLMWCAVTSSLFKSQSSYPSRRSLMGSLYSCTLGASKHMPGGLMSSHPHGPDSPGSLRLTLIRH